MHRFKPMKIAGALLLGTALAGVAACDQPVEPRAEIDDSTTLDTAAPLTASSPSEAAADSPAVASVDSAPVAGNSAPKRVPAGPGTARPARMQATGSAPAPTPTKREVAETSDPHAGHDMDSMADHDIDEI